VIPRSLPRRPLAGGLSLLRISAVAVLGLVVGGLTVGNALGEPAASPGPSFSIVDRGDLAAGLAEVRINARASDAQGAAPRLLAISANGRSAAMAGQIGPEATVLAVGTTDGEQRVELPGIISAAFAPDGSWLAVIDGSGSLWRVAGDGATQMGAIGPFAGQAVVEPDGSVLALRVSSVEAPIASRLVRVSADGTSATPLSEEPLVYGIQRLADGDLVVAAHRRSGNVLLRLHAGRATLLADLGQDAVHASVSADARVAAFERAGLVFVRALGGVVTRSLGNGARPQVAPDGGSVLVELPTGAALFAADGRPVARLTGQAAFAGCVAECGP
jgi:hypothetical protein